MGNFSILNLFLLKFFSLIFATWQDRENFLATYNYNLELMHMKFHGSAVLENLRLVLLEKNLQYGFSDGILYNDATLVRYSQTYAYVHTLIVHYLKCSCV